MWENFYGWGGPLSGFISGNAADRDKRKALLEYVIISSPQHSEKTAFFSSFPHWRTSWLRHFVGYFIGISRKRHRPFSMAHHFYFRHSLKRRLRKMPDVSKPKLLALSWHIVILSLQYIENTNFLFVFSAGGLHAWMISLVILLELALSSIWLFYFVLC